MKTFATNTYLKPNPESRFVRIFDEEVVREESIEALREKFRQTTNLSFGVKALFITREVKQPVTAN